MWTKLTNSVDNLVNNFKVIYTKTNKTDLRHLLFTFTKCYKTSINTKKRSYQDSISHKIINFATCKDMLITVRHNQGIPVIPNS